MTSVGICVRYHEILKTIEDLARHTIAKSKNCHLPLRSHFTNENFTFTAFDNFDHQDESSASRKFSTHDTVITLFQVKPENLPSRPLKTGIIPYKALICMELHKKIEDGKSIYT